MTQALRCILLMMLAAAPLLAQPAGSAEFEVKAAYLYNFARFIQWPRPVAANPTDFSICVVGSDPFGRALDSTLAGVSLRGAKVIANRLTGTRDLPRCHIAFISTSEERNLPAILEAIAGTDVLTVSDMPGFITRGGMIQFVSQARRVRFEVGLVPAQAAGLMFSSELLRVAAVVHTDAARGKP